MILQFIRYAWELLVELKVHILIAANNVGCSFSEEQHLRCRAQTGHNHSSNVLQCTKTLEALHMMWDRFQNFRHLRRLTSYMKPDFLNIHWRSLFLVRTAAVWCHRVKLDRIAISFPLCIPVGCTNTPANNVYYVLGWRVDSWSMEPNCDHLLLYKPHYQREMERINFFRRNEFSENKFKFYVRIFMILFECAIHFIQHHTNYFILE